MILINLDVMMARRKMSLHELSERVGITLANLSVLKNNKAKAIRFSTLDAICRALDCTVGDILEYVPTEDLRGEEDTDAVYRTQTVHPLPSGKLSGKILFQRIFRRGQGPWIFIWNCIWRPKTAPSTPALPYSTGKPHTEIPIPFRFPAIFIPDLQ